MRIRPFLLLCISGLAVAVMACSPSAGNGISVVAPASIHPGDTIPAPSEPVILTISGNVSVSNVDNSLQLDMPTLERMGLVKYSVFDPYLQEDTVYTGVLMSQLADILGATESSDVFKITALDDYQVSLSLAEVQRWPILLATRTNGEYMSVENSGPTRIIWPFDDHPELDPVKYTDLWIWNIESIQVD